MGWYSERSRTVGCGGSLDSKRKWLKLRLGEEEWKLLFLVPSIQFNFSVIKGGDRRIQVCTREAKWILQVDSEVDWCKLTSFSWASERSWATETPQKEEVVEEDQRCLKQQRLNFLSRSELNCAVQNLSNILNENCCHFLRIKDLKDRILQSNPCSKCLYFQSFLWHNPVNCFKTISVASHWSCWI